MRVLVAHNVSGKHPGGMTRIMRFLHRQLQDAGHQVDFLHSEDVPPGARGRLGRFLFPWYVRRRAVEAAARGAPYDLVNVHEPASAPLAAFRPAGTRLRVVVTTHGVEQRAWDLALEEARLGRRGPALSSRVWYPLTSLWQSRLGLTRADAIFCLSSEDRQYLVDHMRVPPARITRVFPGADPLFARMASGRDYGSSTRVIFAGTWRKNKGIEDLVPAFVALVQREPRLTLTVLGAGVPEPTVLEAFPPPLRSAVHTVATKNDAETSQVLAQGDLFLLPSLFEGTPLTLMEAMMSGLPIVTTATCGMRDVLRDGATGLMVPIRSPERLVAAVESLLRDRPLRERLGRAAQAEALSRFTWDGAAAIVAEAYDRILSSTKGPLP